MPKMARISDLNRCVSGHRVTIERPPSAIGVTGRRVGFVGWPGPRHPGRDQ